MAGALRSKTVSDSRLYGFDAAWSSVSPKADKEVEATTTEAEGHAKSSGGSAAAAIPTTDQEIGRIEELEGMVREMMEKYKVAPLTDTLMVSKPEAPTQDERERESGMN